MSEVYISPYGLSEKSLLGFERQKSLRVWGGASLQCGDQVQESGKYHMHLLRAWSSLGSWVQLGSGFCLHPLGCTPCLLMHFLIPSCDNANVCSPQKIHRG